MTVHQIPEIYFAFPLFVEKVKNVSYFHFRDLGRVNDYIYLVELRSPLESYQKR